MLLDKVSFQSIPIAYVRGCDLDDIIVEELFNFADYQGDWNCILKRETLLQMSNQDFWWGEGDPQEPGKPDDYRKNLHTRFQEIVDIIGGAELIFVF